MTLVSAQLGQIRIAPRKLRLVADLVKGKEVHDAEVELRYLVKRGAEPLLKLLKSAIANAHTNSKVPASAMLIIRDFRVDEGRVYKRFHPGARGRAYPFKKRTSHVKLVLETKE